MDLIGKRRQVKNNREKYDTSHEEIRRKCDEAKEKWINDKCRNIELYRRSTEQRKHAHPQDVLSQKILKKEKNPRQIDRVHMRTVRRSQKGLQCNEAQFCWSTYHER